MPGPHPLPVVILVFALLASCGSGSAPALDSAADTAMDRGKLLIIGQDLCAIRGYMASDCCPRPDGLTAYLDFYDILKEGDFGGLGIDPDGNDSGFEFDWNAGPVSAWRTATEFGIDGLAIGLSITENEHPNGLQRLIDGEFDAEILQLAKFAGLVAGTDLPAHRIRIRRCLEPGLRGQRKIRRCFPSHRRRPA